jgi:hypothetical protein
MDKPLNKNSRMDCLRHGDQRPAFICKHLHYGEGCGFHQPNGPPSVNWPFQNAWCDECDKVLMKEGEWNDRSEGFADIMAICESCFEEIKQRNLKQ